MTRETIYKALFDLLKTATSFKHHGRKLPGSDQVPLDMQPAVYIAQLREEAIQKRGLPTVWKLQCVLVLYVSTAGSENTSCAEILNPLLDEIEALFPPAQNEGDAVQTLGGLVSHAWISGEIETYEGTLGEEEIARVPIEILTA